MYENETVSKYSLDLCGARFFPRNRRVPARARVDVHNREYLLFELTLGGRWRPANVRDASSDTMRKHLARSGQSVCGWVKSMAWEMHGEKLMTKGKP
jgi:hypothetical protein